MSVAECMQHPCRAAFGGLGKRSKHVHVPTSIMIGSHRGYRTSAGKAMRACRIKKTWLIPRARVVVTFWMCFRTTRERRAGIPEVCVWVVLEPYSMPAYLVYLSVLKWEAYRVVYRLFPGYMINCSRG